MKKLTAIILTLNEEKNIGFCIESLIGFANQIIVIDSFSTDKTEEIVRSFPNTEFYSNKFVSFSDQFNYALKQVNIKNEWILRIDADELLTKESGEEIINIINDNDKCEIFSGLMLRFRFNFLGRFLKHGGVYPHYMLRVIKKGFGGIENRRMDEHLFVVKGKIYYCKKDCKD